MKKKGKIFIFPFFILRLTLELFNLTYEILILLFLTAVFAGIIDTLAGGGGLITTPALILSGMPPLLALGTNKFQSFVGTATASFMMYKKKKITWNEIKYLMLYSFIGSTIGTILVQFINTEILNFIIPLVLFIIGIYFLFMPKYNEIKKEAKISQKIYERTLVPSIGFYDGMFGPGTGSFFSLSGVAFRAYDLIKATAQAKTMNFASNIASVIVFIIYGQVAFLIGALMMIGQIIGAYLGSHFLLKINPNHLRIIVVFMCFVMLARYIYQMGWIV